MFSSSIVITYDFAPEAEIDPGLTPEELARFLDEPRPRRLPGSLFKRLFVGSSGLRVPWWVKPATAFFLIVMLLATVAFFPWDLMPEMLARLEEPKSTRGTIVECVRLTRKVRRNNGPMVEEPSNSYQVTLEFKTDSGAKIATTRVVGRAALPEELRERGGGGVPAVIHYAGRDPERAALDVADLWTPILLIFPQFIGFALFLPVCLAAFGIYWNWERKKRHLRRVLRYGEPGLATIVASNATGFHIQGQYNHKIDLRIETASGEMVDSKTTTRGPRLAHFRSLQAQGRRLLVLFLPGKPNNPAILGAERPGSASRDEHI